MGIRLSAPTVYEEYPMIRYKANSAGAVVLELVGLAVVLIVPVIIALSMQNFWSLENTYVQKPTVSFTNRCSLRVTMHGGTEKFWACSDAVNTLLIGDARSMNPFFSMLVDDHNSDGLVDNFVFTIGVPLAGAGVAKVEFLPEFTYAVENFLFNIDMTVAPLVTAVNPIDDGSRAAILTGDLQFRETDLVSASPYVSYATTYKPSYFDKIHDVADLVDIGQLARKYADRNITAVFVQKTLDFGGVTMISAEEARLSPASSNFINSDDLDDTSMFQLRINMRVLAAMINYEPSFAEALKWAWVQYFCIAMIVYFLFSYVREFFVKQAIINTIAVWEGYKR